MSKLNIQNSIVEHNKMVTDLLAQISLIEAIAEQMVATVLAGRTIFWMGNGGSAADAQHLAAELVGRFLKERAAIPSIALSTNTSVLTSLSNDYDYSIVFARQLEALCRKGDLVIGISTSGNSSNVILGLEKAKQHNAFTVAFTGCDGGKLKAVADKCLIVPSVVTARVQEAHILVGHILCQLIEEACVAD